MMSRKWKGYRGVNPGENQQPWEVGGKSNWEIEHFDLILEVCKF